MRRFEFRVMEEYVPYDRNSPLQRSGMSIEGCDMRQPRSSGAQCERARITDERTRAYDEHIHAGVNVEIKEVNNE